MNHELVKEEIVKQIEENLPTTKGERFGNWCKDNAIMLIVAFVSLIYIGRGFGEIDKTGKTIGQIINDGAISFVFGYLLQSILGKDGIIRAKRSIKYKNTLKEYGKAVELNTNHIDKVDIFCEIMTEDCLKKEQIKVLSKEGLKYDYFYRGLYDEKINPTTNKPLDEKQIEALDKARKVEITPLTRDLLLSEQQDSEGFDNLEDKVKHYEISELKKNALSKIITSILFAFYTIKRLENLDWGNVLWYALQLFLFILFASIQFYKSYDYILTSDRSRFVRKTNLLYIFNNMVKNEPQRFIIKDKTPLQEDEKQKDDTLSNQTITEGGMDLCSI